ncbi:hypothetical protein PCASD_07415 [Puccinia coronata f. sp. avenae]|uniref:Uncharacterized protein n=1 Tax=Puccinia coronata f. sp. avenae TaxID=200324 RepID=A0A2N5V9A8_9BASI|nr:hypothetical protein PCASD_07415 [Puccinia coronata f. sp. avenae]
MLSGSRAAGHGRGWRSVLRSGKNLHAGGNGCLAFCNAVPFSFNGYNQPGTNGTASARKCGVAAWTGISGGDLGAGGSCRATSGAKGTFTKNPHSIIDQSLHEGIAVGLKSRGAGIVRLRILLVKKPSMRLLPRERMRIREPENLAAPLLQPHLTSATQAVFFFPSTFFAYRPPPPPPTRPQTPIPLPPIRDHQDKKLDAKNYRRISDNQKKIPYQHIKQKALEQHGFCETRDVVRDPALYLPRGRPLAFTTKQRKFVLAALEAEPALYVDKIQSHIVAMTGVRHPLRTILDELKI